MSYPPRRCIYDGVLMAFATQLDPSCRGFIYNTLTSCAIEPPRGEENNPPPPPHLAVSEVCFVEGFWIKFGPELPREDPNFILTDSIAVNLRNIVRAISVERFPVLLQGPTSAGSCDYYCFWQGVRSSYNINAGKTSLVKYLALRTGHEFVRINNHAHTDVQEYLGTYVSNAMGNLVFQEGPLVTAVRRGHWVVLDELNLAPSEVLEMLNRLLDDNRELMIPDTQEVIKPHPDFAVFATQNPTGL
jgi:midasin